MRKNYKKKHAFQEVYYVKDNFLLNIESRDQMILSLTNIHSEKKIKVEAQPNFIPQGIKNNNN